VAGLYASYPFVTTNTTTTSSSNIYAFYPFQLGGTPPTPPFTNNLSVLFNGTNQEVQLPTGSFDPDWNTPFSISIWAKNVNPSLGEYTLLSTRNPAQGYRGLLFEVYLGGFLFQLLNSTSNYIQVESPQSGLPMGVWSSYIVTYDGSGLAAGVKFYLNAAPLTVNTNVDNLNGMTSVSSLGATIANDVQGSYWDGNLNQLSTWNVALTQAQVTAIYNGGTPNNLSVLPFAADLTYWYYLGNGDTPSTIYDHKSTANGTGVNLTSASFVADVP